MPITPPSGFLIPPLKPKGRTTFLSTWFGNLVIRRINALLNLKVMEGDQYDFKISDANAILTIKKATTTEGAAGIINRGEYDASNDYAVNDFVYDKEVFPGCTMSFICETAHVHTGAHTPAWPEPGGTVYWRLVASSGSGEFLLKSVQDDYYTCHTWDGTTEGSDDILVSKAPELRNPGIEVIDGVTVNYSYASTVARTASDGSYAESQKISPRLINDGTIIFASPTIVDGGYYYWQDENNAGRAWCRTQ